MSTTLVPPSYYVVKPRGQTARVFATVTQAATAIVQLAPTPATVSAITGTRSRSLTDRELQELGQRVRAHRLRAGSATGGERGSSRVASGAVVTIDPPPASRSAHG